MKKALIALLMMAAMGTASACSTEWERFSMYMNSVRGKSQVHNTAHQYWKNFQKTTAFKTQCVSNPSFLIGTYRNYLMNMGESLSRPAKVVRYNPPPELAAIGMADALVQNFTQQEAERPDKSLLR